jgi:flagellin-like protein
MKKAWSVRRNEEAVSPVIATILMVAITVVLAAVLYVMVLGFGGGGTTTPTATYSRSTITDGQRVNIVDITEKDVSWDDVKVQVYTGTTYWEAQPVAADLSGGSAVTWGPEDVTTGLVTITFTVVDVSGNGFVSGSDYFTITSTGWIDGASYTAVLLYSDTGSTMGNGVTFTG